LNEFYSASIIRSLCLLLVCVWFGACATMGSGASPRPTVSGASSQQLQTGLRALGDRAQNTQTVRGRGSFTGKWGRLGGRHPFAFALRHPDRLRFDILDHATGLQTAVIVHGQTLYWYVPSEKKVYAMYANRQNMKRMAKLDMQPAELMRMLSGLPPTQTGAWLFQEQRLFSPDRRGEIIFDGSGRAVSEYRHYRSPGGGAVKTRVNFSDYRSVGSVNFPHRIQLETKGSGGKVQLAYDEIEINPSLDASTFTIQVPASTEIVKWE
jgi:outer membrane lipoprotein-sorting protein